MTDKPKPGPGANTMTLSITNNQAVSTGKASFTGKKKTKENEK